MNLREFSDEELDRLSTDVFMEKISRDIMRAMALNRSDIDSAVSHISRCADFGYIDVRGANFGGAVAFEPTPIEIRYTIEDELRDLRISPLDTKHYRTKTGFNPFPMHGVNPSDVFNKKKKKKRF